MTHAVPVPDADHAGTARREAEALARSAGFPAEDIGRTALVATELATNVGRHGGGGALLMRLVGSGDDGSSQGVELIAIDRGPGMRDVARSLQDGVSTYGSAGVGLGAIRRQSEEFDVYSLPAPSTPGQGTVVLSRLFAGRRAPRGPAARLGVVSVPKPGELVCGDGVAVVRSDRVVALMVVDGLGHGVQAHEAATAAQRIFEGGALAPPAVALQRVHAGLRATRGAAVGIVNVDLAASAAAFAGVGNIAGFAAAGGQLRRFVSMNGIAGHTAGQMREFLYPCDGAGLVIVLHSDGLGTNWSLDRYPALASRDPALIAAVLYRDLSRGRDDTTVAVLKRAA